jgi:hypothetical protein
MIKIETASSLQKATLRRVNKAGKSGSSSFASAVSDEREACELSQISGPQMAPALLSMQEVDEREVAKNHGNKVLNLLEQLRLNLLTGHIEDRHLMSLKQYLRGYKANLLDPKLKEVVAEIEQRANIEMAKRGLI